MPSPPPDEAVRGLAPRKQTVAGQYGRSQRDLDATKRPGKLAEAQSSSAFCYNASVRRAYMRRVKSSRNGWSGRILWNSGVYLGIHGMSPVA